MGPDTSHELGPGEQYSAPTSATVHSPHSYFGSSGHIGRQDSPDLEQTIRDLHRDRLSKYAAQMRPPSGVKLKAFVAIGSPDPSLNSLRGCRCLSLGIKADVPGRILIAAGNLINSARFPACDRRLISLPLPHLDRFVIEISADIQKFKGRIDTGFVPVSKHVLEFEFHGSSHFVYTTHKLYAGDRKYTVHVNKECPTEELEDADLCLICLAAKADVAVGECGQMVLCSQCALHGDVRLHRCPFCDALPRL
jgi:hypothetical protein